jgi:predicted nucleic acid-binding Zn ribbon protein
VPIYVYQVIHTDGRPGARFEVRQGIQDPPLTHHPQTGEPVRRVIQPPNIAGKWSESSMKAAISDKNLAEKGFTKYVNTGDGHFEKAAGSGPDNVHA